MTVTDVIKNFRAGLQGILPSVIQVHIPWRRPLAYDEWDLLASTAYNSLVVEVCRWSLYEAYQESFQLPPYDMLLESYRGYSLIILDQKEVVDDAIGVFHSLGTTHDPFDTVEWRAVSAQGKPLSNELNMSPLSEVKLVLKHNEGNGKIRHIKEIMMREQKGICQWASAC